MRDFQLVLEQGRRHFEGVARVERFQRSLWYFLFPAGVLLAMLFSFFRWDLFLLALIIPAAAIAGFNRMPIRLDEQRVARWLDQHHEFKDTLSSAVEFSEGDQQSTQILDGLAGDADRLSKRLRFEEKAALRWYSWLLMALFLLLLLAHFWSFLPASGVAKVVSDLEKLIAETTGSDEQKRDLEQALDDLKKAMEGSSPNTGTGTESGSATGTGTNTGGNAGNGSKTGTGSGTGNGTNAAGKPGDGKNGGGAQKALAAALAKLQETLQQSDQSEMIKQLGQDLSGNGKTSPVGNPLSRNDVGEAAKAAEKMAEGMQKGLKPDEKSSLGQTLNQARNNLDGQSKPAPAHLKKSLEEMARQLDRPGELKKAAEEFGKQLEKLDRQQKMVQDLQKRLAEMAKQAGEKGKQPQPGDGKDPGNKQDGNDGKPGQQNQAGQQGKQGQPGKQGQSGQGKGPGQGQQGKQGQGQPGQQGKQGQNAQGSQSGKNATSQGAQAMSAQNPGSRGQGGNKGGTGGGAPQPGKTPGTQSPRDPRPKDPLKPDPKLTPDQLQKLGQTGKPDFQRHGNLDDPLARAAEMASSAQAGIDFEKGPLMTEREQQQVQLRNEGLAKSREVDEFARRHRIPETFRSYLKDFFQP